MPRNMTTSKQPPRLRLRALMPAQARTRPAPSPLQQPLRLPSLPQRRLRQRLLLVGRRGMLML
jgi:hypothetical protein